MLSSNHAVDAARRAATGRSAERDACLATVLAAFATETVARWVWPSDERFAACAPGFFGHLLDQRLAAGEVWVCPGAQGAIDAVAMWNPPGGLYAGLPDPPGAWAAASAAFTDTERRAWKRFDELMAVPEAAGPHWYLGVLATAPGLQGTGLGRAVTTPMLAAADRCGLPTYLETASETNVAVYARLGFHVDRKVQLPDGGPLSRLMRRDPAQPAPDLRFPMSAHPSRTG